MRYIRFLKPPKVDIGNGKLEALITVTSDLGETFLTESVEITASLGLPSHVVLRKSFQWCSGMRQLCISLNLPRTFTNWPATLSVRMKDENAARTHPWSLPPIIPANSTILDPGKNIMIGEKLVERTFQTPKGEKYSLWEETGESIARHLWDAGVLFSSHVSGLMAGIERSIPAFESIAFGGTRLRVLELGCGVGIVGISIGRAIQCDVVLTDLPEVHQLVEKNLLLNSGQSQRPDSTFKFSPLDWESSLPAELANTVWDLIIAADCTYNADSSPFLVQTLNDLTRNSRGTLVLIAMKVRHSSEAVFFDLMGKAAFIPNGHMVLKAPQTGEEDVELIDVYGFQRTR